MPSIVRPSPDTQEAPAPRAYLHEPCGILATAQWWREHRGICDGCDTTEGWSPLFSDTDLAGPDALDSLPIATLLHSRLASWFGDDRQSFLVADLIPVVTQIVAQFQYNAVEMARKADIAEAERDSALADNALLAAERDDLDTAVGTLLGEVTEWREMAKRLLAGGGA